MGKQSTVSSKRETPKDPYKGKTLEEKIFWIIEPDISNDPISKGYDFFMMGLIVLNILAMILDTFTHRYDAIFFTFEAISVFFFAMDYILRLWTCTLKKKFSHPFYGRVRYGLTFFAIIDLLSFLPFFFTPWFALDLRFLRALRLLRMFKLFKFSRFQTSVKVIKNTIRSKREHLFVTFFIIFVLLIIGTMAFFELEKDAQPDKLPNALYAIYWGLMVLTTVGSDIEPVTVGGRIVAAIIALLGIMMYAIPAGILASGFEEELNRHKKYQNRCPHCHKDLDEEPEDLVMSDSPYAKAKDHYDRKRA